MPVVKFYRQNNNRGKLCGMKGGRNAPSRRLVNQDIISGEMEGGMEMAAAFAELGYIAFDELKDYFGYSWEKKKKKNIEFLEKIIDGKVMGKNKKEMKNITEQMKKKYMRVYIPLAEKTLSLLEKVKDDDSYDKCYKKTMKEFLVELNYFPTFLKEQSKLEKRREKEEKNKKSNDEVIRIENPIKPETPEKKKEYSKETIELKNKIVKELLSFYKKDYTNLNIPKNEITSDIKKIAKRMSKNYRAEFINDMKMMLENQDIKVEEDEEKFLKYMMKKIKLESDKNQIIADKSALSFHGYDVNHNYNLW